MIESVSGVGTAARTTTFDYFPDDTGLPEAGHLMHVTDAGNQNVLFTRDAFGRALSQTVGSDTIALGYTASGDLDTLVTANDDTHV